MLDCKGIIKVPKGKHGLNNPNFKKGYFNMDDQGGSPFFDMGCKFLIINIFFSNFMCYSLNLIALFSSG